MIYERGVAGSRAPGTPIPSLASPLFSHIGEYIETRAWKSNVAWSILEKLAIKKNYYSEYVSLVIPSAIVYKLKIPYAFFSAYPK